jgi:hypothetical protein
MGWISVLKVIAKVAVEVGAVEWAKGWLKRRARGRVDAAKKKYDKQYKVYKEFKDIVDNDRPKDPPGLEPRF